MNSSKSIQKARFSSPPPNPAFNFNHLQTSMQTWNEWTQAIILNVLSPYLSDFVHIASSPSLVAGYSLGVTNVGDSIQQANISMSVLQI